MWLPGPIELLLIAGIFVAVVCLPVAVLVVVLAKRKDRGG